VWACHLTLCETTITMRWPSCSILAFLSPSKDSVQRGNSFIQRIPCSTHDHQIASSSRAKSHCSMFPIGGGLIENQNTLDPLGKQVIVHTEDITRLLPSRVNTLQQAIENWILPSASADEGSPPTKDEIRLLNEALALVYNKDGDPNKAEDLLTQSINAWKRQPADERAALYRIRGDCYMTLLRPNNAIEDFTTALDLLQGPAGDRADPSEIPAARLGRARSTLSLGKLTKTQAQRAAEDYQTALRLTSREDWDTDAENEEDGASRNPYAAWEWGTSLRKAGDFRGASKAHALAALSFKDIGDRPRSIISELDAGIDMAASNDAKEAREMLESAIKKTTQTESRDVALLQRVVAKEGEARLALASLLWEINDGQGAEKQLNEACVRMEQLEADAVERAIVLSKVETKLNNQGLGTKGADTIKEAPQKLKFSIDDMLGAGDISCTKFKSKEFVDGKLNWPEVLQDKLEKLEKMRVN